MQADILKRIDLWDLISCVYVENSTDKRMRGSLFFASFSVCKIRDIKREGR